MLKHILNELRKRPCKTGTRRKGGKCVKLTTGEKRSMKKSLKKSVKTRLKDSKKKAKLDCEDGFMKYKKNGKWRCIKKKECKDGMSFSPSNNKCQKVFKK